MPPLRFAHVETSLGPMWVAETDAGVAAVERGDVPRGLPGAAPTTFPDGSSPCPPTSMSPG